MKKAVYAGSFDPITNGHIYILKRALSLFDEVILLVADNKDKKSRFSVEDRLVMIKEATKDLKGVVVDYTPGYTVHYASKAGAKHLIRGIRTVSDFEYETKLAEANKSLDSNIETIFLLADEEHASISSSKINDMFLNKIDISKLVPESVLNMYKKSSQ